MRCEFGFCINCEKEIAPSNCSCGARKPGPDYTEVLLTWSNGTKMATAVCVNCAQEGVWKAEKMALTKAVWDAWDKKGHTYDKSVTIV